MIIRFLFVLKNKNLTKLFYVIVMVLSFGGLWKILGPTPTSDGNPDIRKRYKTTDKILALH
jgi:hypothetical protein